MIRVDGHYLYTVGHQIHPLSEFRAYGMPGAPPTTYDAARIPLLVAEAALEPLLTRSVFQFRTSVQAGRTLLNAVRALKAKIMEMNEEQSSTTMEWTDGYSITSALEPFEAILAAELSLIPLYIVTPKAGYDTAILIDAGLRVFPEDVWQKAPEAVPDIMQATKCIAFDLPTAAGFHLHRANESVLRRYWDAVAKGKPRPNSRNMGDYLNEMDKQGVGDGKVKAALRHLKDFHRNPLVHPEAMLENADEAIALMNGVHNVVVQMLKEMPDVSAPPAPPAAGSIATSVASPSSAAP